MSDPLFAKRPATKSAHTPAQEPLSANTPRHRTFDSTHLPLYTHAWSNQPPPRLHLPTSQLPVETTFQEEDAPNEVIHQAVQKGLRTPTSTLPHVERIQQSFGRHDISRIQAHLGSEATASAEVMQAPAYTTGDHVVFAGMPDLHTAAHEAAHVIQQRSGIWLTGGISRERDLYEQHADVVADRVTVGRSSEKLLDQFRSEQYKAANTAKLPIIQRGGRVSIPSRSITIAKPEKRVTFEGRGGQKPPPFIKAGIKDFYKWVPVYDKNPVSKELWYKMNDAMEAFEIVERGLPREAMTYSRNMRITLHNWINNMFLENAKLVADGKLYEEFIKMHPRAFQENGACRLVRKYPSASWMIFIAPIGTEIYTPANIRRFVSQFTKALLWGSENDLYTLSVQQAIKEMKQNPVVVEVEPENPDSAKSNEAEINKEKAESDREAEKPPS